MEEGKSVAKEKNTVMVAMDESDYSKRALEWALQFLGDTISKSQLIIFTAEPPVDLSYIYASTYGAAPPELISSIQANQNKAALARLQDAKETCAKHGVVPKTMTEVGNPKEAICEAVEKLDVDLLVMGSHGRGAIQRAFLGSVSNHCVNHAKCPVLVVRKPV